MGFDAGCGTGADGLELDVRLSADGVAIVHHDPTLERTTNASGPVVAKTAAELARVDAGCRFTRGSVFPFRGQGIGVPTLAEVLKRYRDRLIIIDMKDNVGALGAAVARDVRGADAVDRVCAAGYGAVAMQAARAALPELATSAHQGEVRVARYRSWLRCPVQRVAYQGYQVPERVGRLQVVSPLFVNHAHGANLKVQVWTVDREPDMVRLLDWGVDGLISNCPDIAVSVRDRWARHRS